MNCVSFCIFNAVWNVRKVHHCVSWSTQIFTYVHKNKNKNPNFTTFKVLDSFCLYLSVSPPFLFLACREYINDCAYCNICAVAWHLVSGEYKFPMGVLEDEYRQIRNISSRSRYCLHFNMKDSPCMLGRSVGEEG